MRVTFKIVDKANQSRRCIVEFSDTIKYEEAHGVSFDVMRQNPKIRDLAWLCWRSETRRKETALGFDDWCDAVDSIDLQTEEDKIAPLERSQATG